CKTVRGEPVEPPGRRSTITTKTVLRQAQDERLCAAYLAVSSVFPAQAGIHWFTVVGRPNHLHKRTSSRSGFLLPQE
ncbi:MAG: hypothetical protein J4N87_08640, partial [Chloroflexi bacterium]|nr:hypothetical protein [Chloroflexota bacterium]